MREENGLEAGGSFSVAQMLARASAETGLSNFGEDGFREALEQLVDDTNRNVPLTPLGRLVFAEETHRLLVNRLRFARDLGLYPEILAEDVADPVVIIGLPRTGTTKLQRMLSLDPECQSLHYWRLFNPAPFPGGNSGGEDPRIAAAHQALTMTAQLAPGFLVAHPTFADQPDEESFLQLFSFRCMLTYLSHPAHGYFSWLTTQPRGDMYAYMKSLLQYLQWQDGGRRGRHWVLKSPTHVGNLDLVVEMFPNATLVFTHRNFHQAIPSFCRLIEMTWGLRTGNVDRERIGAMALELWSGEMARHLRQRERLPVNILDVHYGQIRDDPLAVIEEILCRRGRAVTPGLRRRMIDWESENPADRFGVNSYRLKDYGLDPDVVDSAFAACHRRFGRDGDQAPSFNM